MKNSVARPRSLVAFTLIELLTVIAIIAILMAMLFPYISSVRDAARKKKAGTDTQTIVHAVEQYNVEYSQYPKINPAAVAPVGGATDDTAGDQAALIGERNATLFNTLRDIDRAPNSKHIQNPKGVVFLDTKIASSTTKPKDGFLEVTGTGTIGCWYDPWGTEYNVIMDSNSNRVIEVDSFYDDFKGDKNPRASVGAFSLGKDKQLGNKGNKNFREGIELSDDTVSWAGQ